MVPAVTAIIPNNAKTPPTASIVDWAWLSVSGTVLSGPTALDDATVDEAVS